MCVVSLKTWVHNLFRVIAGVTAVVFLWAEVSNQTGLTHQKSLQYNEGYMSKYKVGMSGYKALEMVQQVLQSKDA